LTESDHDATDAPPEHDSWAATTDTNRWDVLGRLPCLGLHRSMTKRAIPQTVRPLAKIHRSLRLIIVVVALMTGCLPSANNPRQVWLSIYYEADSKIERLSQVQPVTVFRFTNKRGREGTHNEFFVGGLYDPLTGPITRVYLDTRFQVALQDALITAFRARGGDRTVLGEREFSDGVSYDTRFALAGKVRDFSVELGLHMAAHVRAVVRLYERPRAAPIVEKEIESRAKGSFTLFRDRDSIRRDLEASLNEALAGFVRQVVTDSDITAQLVMKE
jgi:hypothetical protein